MLGLVYVECAGSSPRMPSGHWPLCPCSQSSASSTLLRTSRVSLPCLEQEREGQEWGRVGRDCLKGRPQRLGPGAAPALSHSILISTQHFPYTPTARTVSLLPLLPGPARLTPTLSPSCLCPRLTLPTISSKTQPKCYLPPPPESPPWLTDLHSLGVCCGMSRFLVCSALCVLYVFILFKEKFSSLSYWIDSSLRTGL